MEVFWDLYQELKELRLTQQFPRSPTKCFCHCCTVWFSPEQTLTFFLLKAPWKNDIPDIPTVIQKQEPHPVLPEKRGMCERCGASRALFPLKLGICDGDSMWWFSSGKRKRQSVRYGKWRKKKKFYFLLINPLQKTKQMNKNKNRKASNSNKPPAFDGLYIVWILRKRRWAEYSKLRIPDVNVDVTSVLCWRMEPLPSLLR